MSTGPKPESPAQSDQVAPEAAPQGEEAAQTPPALESTPSETEEAPQEEPAQEEPAQEEAPAVDLSAEIFTSASHVPAGEPRVSGKLSSEQAALLLEEATSQDGDRRERLDKTILGRYQIIDILGRGAFSVVYRASQIGVGRMVALKVFLLHPASRQNQKLAEAALVRFQREARLASQLRHPNTVTLFDYDKTDTSIFYMAFEYVEGPTLSKALKEQPGGLAPARAIHIARQVAQSLEEAHSQGIIHRDLKPGNIMLATKPDGSEHAKVLDFGIAKLVSDSDGELEGGEDLSDEMEVLDLTGLDQDNNADLTQEGRIVGTPRYIPPEQIQGRKLGPSADIYALGLILHEMLTGKAANPGRRAQDLIRWHLEDRPLHLPQGFKYPAGLAHIVQKATSKEASARYQSCRALLEDLDKLQDNGDWRRERRSGLIWAVVAVNVLLLAALLLALYHSKQDSGPRVTITPRPDSAAPLTLEPPPKAPDQPAPTQAQSQQDPTTPDAQPAAPTEPAQPPPAPEPLPEPRNLDVLSEPEGAEVYLGDMKIGLTPLQLALEDEPRPMTFTFKKKGYRPQDARWVPEASAKGSPPPLEVKLKRAAAAPPPKKKSPKYRIIP